MTSEHDGPAPAESTDANATADLDPSTATTDDLPPVVVDLGKVKRKQVKALKRGEGPLLDTVDEVVAAVEQELADELDDCRVLPVVLVVERRPKRRRRLFEL